MIRCVRCYCMLAFACGILMGRGWLFVVGCRLLIVVGALIRACLLLVVCRASLLVVHDLLLVVGC